MFNNVRTYTVYTRADATNPAETAILVPEHFCWAAIIPFYNFVWAVMHKCWLLLVLLLVFYLTAVPQSFDKSMVSHELGWLKLAIFPFLGVFGYDFQRFSLQRRGYQLETVVSGKNESEAQIRYFERVVSKN